MMGRVEAGARPRLIVVSLHKSGTHLVLRLIEELGYHRRYFDEPLIAAARREPAGGFFSALAQNAAFFLHDCRIDGFPRSILEHWREHDDPKFIYQYRDPRAVLLSQVNYLRGSHARKTFSATPYHLVFSDILRAQRSEEEALDVAIQCMGDYLQNSFLGSVWMLHHPKVLRLSYESLVGAPGGGTHAAQIEQVSRVLEHLGVSGDPGKIAPRLYDPSQPTFHRGKVDAWRDVYTPLQIRLFEQRYGHLLDIYGYWRAATEPR